jgi:hypothetical protein
LEYAKTFQNPDFKKVLAFCPLKPLRLEKVGFFLSSPILKPIPYSYTTFYADHLYVTGFKIPDFNFFLIRQVLAFQIFFDFINFETDTIFLYNFLC